MKKSTWNITVLLTVVLCTFFTKETYSQQTLTQINGWNAYVHLPSSYSANPTKAYPTIIFFPGIGEVGTNAPAVISNGPGAYIAQGWNGNVTVDGNNVEFIVISLQTPLAYPTEYTMNIQIQAIKSLYRVDTKRLYLTGLSHGGWCSSTFVSGDAYGGPYTYASQIAAVVTVEGVIPNDNTPYPQVFDNYAKAGGKYLGFEQAYDNRDTKTVVDRMNYTVPNSAIYIQTNFGSGGHCCWASFYGGQGTQPTNWSLGGVTQNIYQWMARQTLGGSIPPVNQAPTANAGIDKIIILPITSITLAGSGTDADGTIASYSWTKVSGPAAGLINSSSSATTTLSSLALGVYTFQLKVTDDKGASATDNVIVTVIAAPVNLAPTANAGVDKTITLPTNSISLAGSGTDVDGTIASYSWTKISGPSVGTITSPSSATTTVSSLAQGAYTFQIKVTDNSGSSATDNVNVTVNAAPVNQAPVANAGNNQTITLPTSSVTLSGSGTDSDGTIASYLWKVTSGPAGSSFSNASAATTLVNGLVAGTYIFQLTVKDDDNATATATTQIVVNNQQAALPPVIANSIHVNLYGGSNPYTNSKWNNWNINAGLNSSKFLYEDKSSSTVSASITGDVFIVDNGQGYASSAVTPPSSILRYNSASTSYRTLIIQGLDISKQYSFEFYASRSNYGNKTQFQLNGINAVVITDNNINSYAKFIDISPDAQGKINVIISSLTVWNYLAGFSIIEQDNGTAASRINIAGEAGVINNTAVTNVTEIKTPLEKTSVIDIKAIKTPEASVYPNPFVNYFQVRLKDIEAGKYTLILSDIFGKQILVKKITKGSGASIEGIQVNNLAAGNYLLQVINDKGNKMVYKLIRQ